MTPEQAIAALDRQLKAHGQSVTVRRYTSQSGTPRPKLEIEGIKGFVRAVKADDLVGDVKSTSSNLTLSPSDVNPFWPLLTTDKIVIAGRECAVLAVKPFVMDNVLVRVNLMVAG